MASKIEEIIREKGFKGSSSTIRHYASEWKKRFKKEIKETEEGKFLCFCEQYPFFKIILELITSFKDIFAQNKPELLKEWIEKAQSKGIEKIISFTNDIERDYEAVLNAICLPYSNGLAE